MKIKQTIIGTAAIGFFAYLVSVYIVKIQDTSTANDRLENFTLNDKSSLDFQAMKVLAKNGCGYCHTNDTSLPFYASLPVAKDMIQKDVQKGLAHFDLSSVYHSVENFESVSGAALNKLERVVHEGSMPMANFRIMHWASGLSEDEEKILLDWIKEKRLKQNYGSPVNEERKLASVQPIHTYFSVDENKAKLGEQLFHDTRLSGDNTVSCASCHNLSTGGVDRLKTSVGIHKQVGGINAPTVYNAAFNNLQFWDGRAADLQEQAGGPPFNSIEMGSENWEQIITKLAKDESMVAQFNTAYAGEINGQTIADAIAEFEKTLITPNSRFDQYLKGDESAISKVEKEGYQLFQQYSCDSCHSGQILGGESFEVMGLKADYFGERGNVTKEDLGRYNVTGIESDKHRFKVPTLRNVALTQPYFHDGHAETLEQAISDMAVYQSGVELTDREIDAIKQFLVSLTGEYKGKTLQ